MRGPAPRVVWPAAGSSGASAARLSAPPQPISGVAIATIEAQRSAFEIVMGMIAFACNLRTAHRRPRAIGRPLLPRELAAKLARKRWQSA